MEAMAAALASAGILGLFCILRIVSSLFCAVGGAEPPLVPEEAQPLIAHKTKKPAATSVMRDVDEKDTVIGGINLSCIDVWNGAMKVERLEKQA